MTVVSLLAAGCLLLVVGCGGDGQESGVNDEGAGRKRSMWDPPTEDERGAQAAQFSDMNTGYSDGLRDGKKAWFDVQPMWVWFKSEAYQSSYDRGWKDGRNLRKINEAE